VAPDDRTPVIVGCGAAVDRPAMLSHALGPIGLMALAARRGCRRRLASQGVFALQSFDRGGARSVSD
jgi:hypothetical protein